MLFDRLWIFILIRSPRSVVYHYYLLVGKASKLDEKTNNIYNGIMVKITNMILECPFIADGEINSQEFDSALTATKQSTGWLLSSIISVWGLDLLVGYSMSNGVYGLIISGSAGMIMGMTNMTDTDNQFTTNNHSHKKPELYNTVARTIALFAFILGIYIRVATYFLTETGILDPVPIPDAQVFNFLYIFILCLIAINDSLVEFLGELLEYFLYVFSLVAVALIIKVTVGVGLASMVAISGILIFYVIILIVLLKALVGPLARGARRLLRTLYK